jgi:hypothetical protein
MSELRQDPMTRDSATPPKSRRSDHACLVGDALGWM